MMAENDANNWRMQGRLGFDNGGSLALESATTASQFRERLLERGMGRDSTWVEHWTSKRDITAFIPICRGPWDLGMVTWRWSVVLRECKGDQLDTICGGF